MLHYTQSQWSQSESASEGEEGSQEWEPSSRVGEEYQAELPEYSGPVPRSGYREDDSELCTPGEALWKPQMCKMSEKDIEQFIVKARKAHFYTVEQALGMLQWHDFNADAALEDMKNFVQFPDEMVATEDHVMFEEAYANHGKCFRRIHEIMSDKDIGSLIRYYYNWKKGPSGVGAIERRTRRAKSGRILAEAAAAAESGTESDGSSASSHSHSPDQQHHRESVKSFAVPTSNSRKQARNPRGFSIDVATLTKIASVPRADMVERLRNDVAEVRRHIQCDKEELRRQDGRIRAAGFEGDEPRQPDGRKSNRWTEEEVHVARQSLRAHGKDFNTMASLLENKNPQQCRNFYMNHRRRLNLDRLVAEAGQPELMVDHGTLIDHYTSSKSDMVYHSGIGLAERCVTTNYHGGAYH